MSPQRGFVQFIISPAPHISHRSLANVLRLQVGQLTYSGRAHPEQTACPFSIGFMQFGQRYPNGLRLWHFGQTLASRSMNSAQ